MFFQIINSGYCSWIHFKCFTSMLFMLMCLLPECHVLKSLILKFFKSIKCVRELLDRFYSLAGIRKLFRVIDFFLSHFSCRLDTQKLYFKDTWIINYAILKIWYNLLHKHVLHKTYFKFFIWFDIWYTSTLSV